MNGMDTRPVRLRYAPSRTSSHAAILPACLLEMLRKRLSVAALTYAAAALLAQTAGLVGAHHLFGDASRFMTTVPVGLVMVVSTLLLYAALRRGWFQAPTLVWVGLGFEVAGSLGIALATAPVLLATEGTVIWGISWICVWVTSFGLIVPAPPKPAVVAGVLSGAMHPLGLGLWMLLSGSEGPVAGIWFQTTIPCLIAGGIVALTASFVYQLGEAVDQAERLGSYTLEDLLGEGGMGQVWRASHRTLARPAAVKLIRPELLQDEAKGHTARLRLRREAEEIARLGSPHTVELYDFGVTEDETFYYVMELLDGLDAQQLIEQHGGLPAGRVVFLLRQLCHSLAEAHAAGVVHRDIKPGNVFVCRKGLDFDFVKVLDFGLAKASKPVIPDDGLQTAGGGVTGTPAYMAPEVLLGGEADTRSDVYAIGCVAYWLLAGKHIFGDGPVMQIAFRHINDSPPRLSTEASSGCPEALDELVLDCLAKQPEDRPADAGELLARLARIEPEPAWSVEMARAWWESRVPATPSPTNGYAETVEAETLLSES